MSNAAKPLDLHREVVLPEWVDYNGHLNVAYYMLAFDHATDAVLDYLDLGADYRRRSGHSNFVVEAHIVYARELHAGDAMRITSQLLGADAKRLHLFHRMYAIPDAAPDADNGDAPAATVELMILNVDMTTRRAASMPEDALARLEPVARAHARLERPPEAGRTMGLG